MRRRRWLLPLIPVFFLLGSCHSDPGNRSENTPAPTPEKATLDVLSYRYFQSDQELFELFTVQTGIPVRVTRASRDSLLGSLDTLVTDVVIGSTVGDLQSLKEAGVLEVFSTGLLDEQVSNFLYKDKGGYWIGLTRKAAAFVYARKETGPEDLPDYSSVTAKSLRGKVLASGAKGSPSELIVAAMLAEGKREEARRWAAGVGANRLPENPPSDYEIIQAVARGEATVGIIFAPSHIQLQMSGNPEMFKVGEATGIVFPANEEGGTYTELSCASVVRGTVQRAEALRFLEFLTSEQGQEPFARTLHEYPANVRVLPSDFVINLGGYREARVEPARVAAEYEAAGALMRQMGW